jgi:hypothetical protein
VEFGIVGILPMVVDSLDGIDYLMIPQIMLANVTLVYELMQLMGRKVSIVLVQKQDSILINIR